MGQTTPIGWTDATWNPVRGCSRISPGCLNCYAEKVAARFSDPDQPFHLFAERKPKAHWTGKVELVESHLADPLKWRKPRRIFVNSMSDLFHEELTNDAIDEVFAVMAQSPQHTFQILTKRPERMLSYLSHPDCENAIDEAGMYRFGWCHSNIEGRWPLPNVHLGVSVENQSTADARIPLLLKTPAAIRFISYEPALGPVNFEGLGLCRDWRDGTAQELPRIDWVIVGGESGPNARPFDVQWARNIIRQCRDSGTACFVKQMGSVPIAAACRQLHYEWGEGNFEYYKGADFWRIKLKSRSGSDPSEWPDYLRVQEFPCP